MLLDRRAFLASSTAILALSGCATVPRRDAAGCSPLPPVHVSPDRVIRTAAGLRSATAGDVTVTYEPPSFPAKSVVVARGGDRVEIEHLEVVSE